MRISDWSSDVCSSDLGVPRSEAIFDGKWGIPRLRAWFRPALAYPSTPPSPHTPAVAIGCARPGPARSGIDPGARQDRKSGVEGKSGSVRVDLGGRRILTKKKNTHSMQQQ